MFATSQTGFVAIAAVGFAPIGAADRDSHNGLGGGYGVGLGHVVGVASTGDSHRTGRTLGP